MAKYQSDQIRNVAILGHSGSGKTTLTETLLYKTKAISRLGRVEDGTTVSDWDPEEQRRGISINLSVIPVEVDDKKLNLLDTPGYLDFMGELISALHVSEAVLLLVDSVAGVEVGTELAWDRLQDTDKPRIVFVNKMDRENADYEKVIADLQGAFEDAKLIPLQLPIGQGEDFSGVMSLVTMKAYMGSDGTVAEVPEEMADAVEAARLALVEASAETDDELIMKYLDGEELTAEEVRRGLFQGVADGSIVPIYFGSATADIGLNRLLKALTRYVPAPTGRDIEATESDETIELACDVNGPAGGLVFKTIVDRFVGRMNYVRLVSGTISKDDRLVNVRTGTEERIANLFTVSGKELEAVSQLAAGDIGVITKLEDVTTGDTLAAPDRPIAIAPPNYPLPLYGVAVTPATQADSAKIGQSLTSLTEEDPTLRVEYVAATKQNVLQGMGDSHVDVALRRLEQKYGVNVETSIPKVPYQETISSEGSAQYRHKKQSGGAGQFAEVHMRVEPRDTGEGFEYSSEIFGGSISRVYWPSIEKGIRQVMDQGVVAGYPVVDVKAIIFDGKEHPVDSKDIAFQTAGREVFKLAMQGANPVLLEPIYRIQVVIPDEYMGDIMGDLNTRRARVQGMEQRGNRTIVNAEIPLAEAQRYGTDLRSMTQGRGIYSLEFDRYEQVPRHLIEEIIAAHVSDETDD